MPEVEVYPGETETEEIESLVRLRLITHNARLVDARKALSMTGKDMTATAGLSRSHLRDIENLRAVPTDEEMVRIACVLEKPIDYLFPEELLSSIRLGVFSRRKMDLAAPEVISLTEAQMLRLTYDGETALIEEVSRTLLREEINEVLKSLDPRERRVLELRFGLKDGQSRTQEEVSKQFNLTRQRIHQIEAKALRKLRHPSRARRLENYLD